MRPPKAIIEVPTAAVAKVTARPSPTRPSIIALASDHSTTTLAAPTSTRLSATDFSRNRVASYCRS